jgi:hypothetical protein
MGVMKSLSRILSLCFAAVVLLASPAAQAQPAEVPAPRRIAALKLETVEVQGSSRISAERLRSDFGLTPGIELNDTIVMDTRSRLLGIGLFNSVILIMKRGSAPGLARLIVELEDDTSVLTDWAIGGELGITIGETAASSVNADGPPRGYRMGLVARNLLGAQHRAALQGDIDAGGILREGRAAWGLPRFAMEEVQFDAEIHGVDVTRRWLNASGFAVRSQALWSQSNESLGEIQYGMAAYVNRKKRFGVPGFPEAVGGPKIAWWRETRLRTFVPSSGWMTGGALLLDPIKSKNSVIELRLARTAELTRWCWVTLDLGALAAGIDASSVRAETRFDLPLTSSDAEEQASVFMRLRGGLDRTTGENGEVAREMTAAAGILGLRWHSSGFIAELGLQITRSPEDVIRSEKTPPVAGGAP